MKTLSYSSAFVFVFLFIIHFSYAQNDSEYKGLKGNVKSVYEVTYKLILEKNKPSDQNIKREEESNGLKTLLKFTRNGKLYEACRFNPDGSIYDKSIHIYDPEKNNRINEAYRYTQEGRRYLKYIHDYDEQGKLCLISIYTVKDSLRGRFEISCNDAKTVTEKSFRDANGKLKYTCTYSYDEAGNMTEEKCLDPDGKLLNKTTCKFDSAGRLCEENSYSKGTSKQKYVCIYDSAGNKIEEKFYTAGILTRSVSAQYDKTGRRMKDTETDYKSDGTLLLTKTNTYTYDEQNNWIKKTIFENDIPRYVVIRDITYY